MVSYCDMQPSKKIMCSFKKRGDNQITSLEILSIALGEYKYEFTHAVIHALIACVTGISSFAKELEGRDLVIWSDNSGAESATRRGVHCFSICRRLCRLTTVCQGLQSSSIKIPSYMLSGTALHS